MTDHLFLFFFFLGGGGGGHICANYLGGGERRHRTTKVMTYNYSKFTIVIQAMMFKQMLVRYKLFVLRSDASRFTANIVSPEYFTKPSGIKVGI